MAEETKFTKAEVKFMYRAFKTECPNGIIDEDTFKVKELVTRELFILWCGIDDFLAAYTYILVQKCNGTLIGLGYLGVRLDCPCKSNR
jgi:hypothetical protein